MMFDEENDGIVTLHTANGEEVEFIEIAGIVYKDGFYGIMQPVELLDGMSDDEALVFKVTRGENGEHKYEIELDDEVINGVFEVYDKLYQESLEADNADNND